MRREVCKLLERRLKFIQRIGPIEKINNALLAFWAPDIQGFILKKIYQTDKPNP